MLKLKPKFDLDKDVVSDILRKEASVCRVKEYFGAVDACFLNIERDGGILFSWKGAAGTTRIGKYDPNTRQNKLLYTFDKLVCVSSCSLNKEETLLAISLTQNTSAADHLDPASKCLTLLIEIHPINNTKVLKAVDCRVKVQFLDSGSDRRSVLESHLLLLTEDGYVDLYHVLLARQEGYRVVVSNPERLSRTAERVVEDFCWIQWDGHTQRIYYLTRQGGSEHRCLPQDKFLLRCVQFHLSHHWETALELPLELPPNPFRTVKFINLGFDRFHADRPGCDLVRMEVFTSRIGSMCVCYSQPRPDDPELTYTVVLVHKDCSKTFRVRLDRNQLTTRQLHPVFIPTGYYILVYLQGHFLHCVNTRQQEMLCHSLFLSGAEAELDLRCHPADVAVLHAEEESVCRLLDLNGGRIHAAEVNPEFLLQILRSDAPSRCPGGKTEPQRLAALHCLQVYLGNDPKLELKIIEWLCDNVNTFSCFDQIQEFILASLYRISYEKSLGLDKVLPYSSVINKKEVPSCLLEIPGVLCTTELHLEPAFKGKARHPQGFWSELQWNTERTKYLNAVPNPRFRTSLIQTDKPRSERRSSGLMDQLEENTKKVLSMVDTWCLDKKLVPLFQEEDRQQRALIGLTVDKLREHLNRHLPRIGKKKVDLLVVSYVAKLLELIRHMLESVWLKFKLGPCVLCFTQRASPAEWAVLHFMFRILEAMRDLCLPLPPGYHTLLAVFAVRCLPHHTFLQYIDHGVLQLTETFVSRLMTDLDNSAVNERLKFSVLKRLPLAMERGIYRTWDHPISSASISRSYVRTVLEKHSKTRGFALTGKDDSGRSEFLPLAYLAKLLSDIEQQALNPFEEHVDAEFVQETALKQTLVLLGLEEK
ncbi:gamma-secretase-activating protein isoform X2 [Takifugu rubripes]|uniref:gamma-secretase-activating protein isoform X2 n=1 Tax=Takifugu rubripes TaxID=31033 RepID=UPI0005D1A436|nr:gamma-secretase-activating protein isoform X2 [Takifugu rubripes]|eukprot:XP_003972953.2 PREDICTED: gamma-secretase-activating protein isoform X2 [Takifugu rubripes]